MSRPKLFLLLSLVALVLSPAVVAQAAAAKPVGTLADFAWFEGRWTGTLGNTAFHAEQEWWPAKAGVMMGMFRLTDGDKLLILEFFTLRETANGVELRLRHFDAELVPLEKGDPIILRLVSLKPDEFLFENPMHAQPKTSRLTRTGPHSFTGRSEIIRADGSASVIEVPWTRQP